MSIYRKARPTQNFYLLDKAISEDARLSWAARGLLVFLLGKPDHWRVSTSHLVKQTEGSIRHSKRDAVRGLLSELIEAGYVTREPVRDESGTFKGTDYAVSEIPHPPEAEEPATEKPETDNPAPVDPLQVSIEGVARIDPPASNETPEPPPSPDGETADEEAVDIPDVQIVFEHWKTVMEKNVTTKLGDKRRKRIEAALKTYPLEDIKRAIDGCRLTPHNMGDNERGQKYNDIELILRDEIHIERFMENAINPPKPIRRPMPTSGFAETDYRKGLRKDSDGRYRI